MAQNMISLNFTDADLTTIDEGLALLEQKLAPLTGLSPDVFSPNWPTHGLVGI